MNNWNKIENEISSNIFKKMLKDTIFKIIKIKNDTVDDKYLYIEPEEYKIFKKTKQKQMKMGELHELIGEFLSRQKLKKYPKRGKNSKFGLDLVNNTSKEAFELKNKSNTLNSDSAKSVNKKLLKAHKEGYVPYLVQMNCDENKKIPRHQMDSLITLMNDKNVLYKIGAK